MPRLSVVVPVYNVEDYLDDCLMSLEGQDYADFEAVCVNDGSTDSSGTILTRWACSKPWVKVIDKENGGLSSARNAGIRAASGEYVCFLDSDDRLMPTACRRIVESFDKTGADVLVYGGYVLPREDTTPWYEHALTPGDATFEGFCEEFVFSEKTHPFAWRTAVRRDFLMGAHGDPIMFDEDVRYGEDQVFQFCAYGCARKAATISDRLYEYRARRVGSLMSDARKDGEDLLRPNLEIMNHVLDDYQRLGMLDNCRAPMMRWLARFIGHDALMLDDDTSAAVMEEFADGLKRHWNRADIEDTPLEAPVRETLLLAMDGCHLGTLRRKNLWLRLHYCLFWRGNVTQKIRRRLH